MPDRRPLEATDYILVAIICGLMGAFYWAIRGTGGFGGAAGGALAGFGWALLWHAFSHSDGAGEHRPYSHAWMVWAITLGIAFGGLTGYGVYTAWVRGTFYLDYPGGVREVGAWTGYAMLFVCGLHWGGNTGCFMAWCAPGRPVRGRDWLLRIACGVAGAVAAGIVVRVFPQLFLPFYGEGLYQVEANATCQRAVGSIHNIAWHVGLFLGFLGYEIGRRDWRAVGMILVLALGFAIPFAVGGAWHTMHGSELKIGWWKNWEMTIGLGGGLAFGLAFFLFNRPAAASRPALGAKSRAFFASYFPFWLPALIVCFSVYDGLSNLHGFERTAAGHIIILVLLTAVVGATAWRRIQQTKGQQNARFRLPFPEILAFQALIIAAGYLTSIPGDELRLANKVLLVLYTIYIGCSCALAFLLYRRRQTSSPRQA